MKSMKDISDLLYEKQAKLNTISIDIVFHARRLLHTLMFKNPDVMKNKNAENLLKLCDNFSSVLASKEGGSL